MNQLQSPYIKLFITRVRACVGKYYLFTMFKRFNSLILQNKAISGKTAAVKTQKSHQFTILTSWGKFILGMILCFTLASNVSEASVPDLLIQLGSTNEFDRAKAAIALGHAKDAGTVRVLSKRFDVDSSKMVKLYILQALVEIGGQEAVKGLERGLLDADPDVRIKAARSLERFSGRRSDSKLRKALYDSNVRVKLAVARSLGTLEAKQVLLALTASNDSEIRAHAILALSAIQAEGPSAKAAVERALRSSDKRVKAAAEWSAPTLGIEVKP